ncbi:hypothetical protein Lal_00016793, partial [Lupinus albus]
YGTEVSSPNVAQNWASRWWKNIYLIGSNLGSIGDGSQTLFWLDTWLGNQSLKEIFPRLFALASSRIALNHTCKMNSADRWSWSVDASGSYSVKSAAYLNQFEQTPCFVWKLIRERLRLRNELLKRNVSLRLMISSVLFARSMMNLLNMFSLIVTLRLCGK